jgi:hypothetical protein
MLNTAPIVIEEIEETETKTRNWKQYVKPAAFVTLTVAVLAGTLVLSRKMSTENSIEA